MHFALFTALFCTPIQPVYAGDGHSHEASASHCECLPDCECHQPGGSCPSGLCSPDCDCDAEYIDGRGISIHPAMRAAIEATEKKTGAAQRTSAGPADLSSDFIYVNGVKQYTGFHPTWDIYDGAKVHNFKASKFLAAEIPKSYDYRTFSYSPVHGQPQGSCWAEAAGGVMDFNVNAMLGTKLVFAVQDFIDCSNFGSARSGGSAPLEYAKKEGIAFEESYTYTGRDGRCKKDVERHHPLQKVEFLRGATGRLPTAQELQLAVLEFGAMEVCGSASSLGNGGRQDTIRGGNTNHCYVLAGWLDGKSLGWLDAVYFIIKNSWGDGSGSKLSNGRKWGDAGYGYYPLAKGDGVHLKGSVITEIQMGYAGPILPKEPVVFSLKTDSGLVLNINIAPVDLGAFSQEKLSELIAAAIKEVEAA